MDHFSFGGWAQEEVGANKKIKKHKTHSRSVCDDIMDSTVNTCFAS